MSTRNKVALVVGAHGVIGRNLDRAPRDARGLGRHRTVAARRTPTPAGSGTSRSTCSTATTPPTKLGGLTRGDPHLLRRLPGPADLGRAGARPTSRCSSTSSSAVEPVAAGPAARQPDAGLQGLRRAPRSVQDAGPRERPAATCRPSSTWTSSSSWRTRQQRQGVDAGRRSARRWCAASRSATR